MPNAKNLLDISNLSNAALRGFGMCDVLLAKVNSQALTREVQIELMEEWAQIASETDNIGLANKVVMGELAFHEIL
jgi:hypothetical protein